MPIHLAVNWIGMYNSWRSYRRRQQVPYVHMVSPMMAPPAPEDPSYEPAPPEEPEPEPRCLCGSMSLTSGATTVGVIELVLYCFCAVVALVYGFGIGAFDQQAAFGALLVLGIHITFNSLLVHGARTGSHCMVLSWTIYQGISNAFTSCALIYFFVVAFGIIDDDSRLRHIGFSAGFAALLALEWWFFAVGVLLSQWLSRKRGVVIRVRQPLGAQAGQPQYQPQCPPQYPPQYPPQCPPEYLPQYQPQYQPQYLPQQNQPHPQQYHPQQPQGNLQQPQQPQYQPQQYQHQPQQPGTGPDAPPPYDIVEKSSAIP